MSKKTRFRFFVLCFLSVSFTTSFGFAQTPADTSLTKLLDSVIVTASRMAGLEQQVPYALTVSDAFYMQTGQRQLSINEALQNIPGLVALNPDNFAQDLRVSIRGFGARAAFGIRGIKIMVDGLPESTPDGQAQVDNLDLGAFQQMEVIRGASSSLYGNAAGGVISFSSEALPSKPYVELGLTTGSFGLQRSQLKTGWQQGKLGGFLHVAHTQTNGYRSQSAMQSTLLYNRLEWKLNTHTHLKLIYNYVFSPKADDPGALTRPEADNQRRAARDRNVMFATGEAVEQGKVGAILTHQFSPRQRLQLKGFFLDRSFSNRLPFENGGIVQLRRAYAGGGATYYYQNQPNNYRIKAGIDIENQRDNRQRYQNLQGTRGAQTLYQIEGFATTGLFVLQDIELSPVFKVNLGTRYDVIKVSAIDRFLSNGDASGNQSFRVFNPSLGVVYSFAPFAHIYANLSTSFETPALSELSANPQATGGFNPELTPQKAISYELGVKGLAHKKLNYTAALFYIQVQNELLPFELAAFPQRIFYNNAGASTRQGIETSLKYQFVPGVLLEGSYTFSRFVFDSFVADGQNYAGKVLPGIPQHMGHLGARYIYPNGSYIAVSARFNGRIFANNDNSVVDPGYQLVNLRAGWKKSWKNWAIEPFAGVNNLLNMRYTSNLRINAFGKRFYEPGATINFYGGVRVRFF
ncbi:TonB-dependent receptor family protein [Microscilla marina]|uniref:Probable TonB-dependent receptor yncD, putative n=1 Tax=Microscilla marina ATCC 23134 TaxID=313606 RepID=A1ZHP9_MICM2|nr:TonB-dependent receptor [Microscilla marina]EAY30056.1 probable TonB-dependent receptor yncD, putative [Microscilla marina ATCC 23134]